MTVKATEWHLLCTGGSPRHMQWVLYITSWICEHIKLLEGCFTGGPQSHVKDVPHQTCSARTKMQP